jgi:hypothetical protein
MKSNILLPVAVNFSWIFYLLHLEEVWPKLINNESTAGRWKRKQLARMNIPRVGIVLGEPQ